ncbi:MAG: hypothetical protein M9894_05820 [Planctomycetes bacterium]|nr:hypothetical protein [Planctomycetota bacterium]
MGERGGTTFIVVLLGLFLPAVGCGGGGADPAPTPAGGATSPRGGVTSPAPAVAAPACATTASVGMNLTAVSYYSPEWPFVDAMRSSRVNAKGYPWDLSGGGPEPPLDPQGYPVGLADGQSATTYTLMGGGHPAGRYVVLFEGAGEVEVRWDGGRARHAHGGGGVARFTADVASTRKGLTVRITRSSADDHVRGVRVLLPGFEATHEAEPFHPLFLERLRPFSALRFMDWGETNHSPVTSWSERKRPDHRSQDGKNGVAYEVMADLCNRTGKHMWVCVPHRADDDYVRRLAALLKDALDPRLQLFVEYSNEVWNGAFGQHREVTAAARAEGLEWWERYARRSAEVFDLFERELGGRERLVRVVGAHAANPGLTERLLAALPRPDAADALAIAPYFGGRLGSRRSWRTTRGWSVDQVLDACAADLERQRDLVRRQRALAREAGLTLVAYEGGQHLVGVGEAVEDGRLTELFVQANRHPRMRQLYRDYLALWREEGGGLFVHFSSTYAPQKWGCWGALERQDADPAASPKYSALAAIAQEWARAAASDAGAR